MVNGAVRAERYTQRILHYTIWSILYYFCFIFAENFIPHSTDEEILKSIVNNLDVDGDEEDDDDDFIKVSLYFIQLNYKFPFET